MIKRFYDTEDRFDGRSAQGGGRDSGVARRTFRRGFPRRNGSPQDDVDPCDLRCAGRNRYGDQPTFAIVNEYRGEGIPPVYHFDFYRIDRIEEAFDFGYEEYFYGGDLCLVEWPKRLKACCRTMR